MAVVVALNISVSPSCGRGVDVLQRLPRGEGGEKRLRLRLIPQM